MRAAQYASDVLLDTIQLVVMRILVRAVTLARMDRFVLAMVQLQNARWVGIKALLVRVRALNVVRTICIVTWSESPIARLAQVDITPK